MNKKMIATLVLSTFVASSFTLNAGAANSKQVLRDEHGKLHNVVGNLGKVTGATAEARALDALNKVSGDFGIGQANGKFKLHESHVDENGTTHTKMDRLLNNIPVFGQQMIVHETAGQLDRVTGDFDALTPTATQATLSQTDAIAKATAFTGYSGQLDKPATATLNYFPQDGQAVLSYKINLSYGSDQPGNWTIFVNATDGSIVNSVNDVENYTMTTGTGTGVLGDTKTIHTSLYTNIYYLEDHTKAMTGDIETYTYNNGTGAPAKMSDSDNIWNAANQRAGVDAHFYAGVVFDYYKGLGRNSLNGAGGSIYSAVHYSSNYNNAFWNGSYLVYGDGDGTTFLAMSGDLDVPGHELTHVVTDSTSALIYSNQQGALSESWSDAQAVTIENDTWLIADKIYTPSIPGDALRSLANPSLYGQPMNMSQYVTTTSDNGGVHTNSGIPNYAYYLFATDIGSRAIAGKIWYTASRDYMTSSTNFSGARAATLAACAALYGSGSTYYTKLKSAWSGVGIN
ncbi:MAG: M4 family metallopeptidase [Tumebacillaceae bacterium]